MYNKIRGFYLYFKISKKFLKEFINPNSLYIYLPFLCIITAYHSFNVSLVLLTRYTLSRKRIKCTTSFGFLYYILKNQKSILKSLINLTRCTFNLIPLFYKTLTQFYCITCFNNMLYIRICII